MPSTTFENAPLCRPKYSIVRQGGTRPLFCAQDQDRDFTCLVFVRDRDREFVIFETSTRLRPGVSVSIQDYHEISIVYETETESRMWIMKCC